MTGTGQRYVFALNSSSNSLMGKTQGLYIFSGIGCSGALIILSFVKSGVLWQIFLVQGVLLGIAIAFGAQPALVIVGHHFVRRRALVMGIVAASGSVGGVCFPLIFAQLAKPNAIGYEWSLRVVAIIAAYVTSFFRVRGEEYDAIHPESLTLGKVSATRLRCSFLARKHPLKQRNRCEHCSISRDSSMYDTLFSRREHSSPC